MLSSLFVAFFFVGHRYAHSAVFMQFMVVLICCQVEAGHLSCKGKMIHLHLQKGDHRFIKCLQGGAGAFCDANFYVWTKVRYRRGGIYIHRKGGGWDSVVTFHPKIFGEFTFLDAVANNLKYWSSDQKPNKEDFFKDLKDFLNQIFYRTSMTLKVDLNNF